MTQWEWEMGLCLLQELARRELISQALWAGACRLWQRRQPDVKISGGEGQP